VIGSSGSGKTTVAAELARRLGVPHVELDALHHGPHWTEATAEELRERVEAALAGLDGWVVDGNYMGKLGLWVVERADTILWLDLPLRTSLRRMWQRTSERIRGDVELWSGNKERWRNAFVGWNALFPFTVRAHFRRKWEWPRRLAHLPVVRLRSAREVSRWVEELPPPPASG
jgi:adenylate kinase family enzyme